MGNLLNSCFGAQREPRRSQPLPGQYLYHVAERGSDFRTTVQTPTSGGPPTQSWAQASYPPYAQQQNTYNYSSATAGQQYGNFAGGLYRDAAQSYPNNPAYAAPNQAAPPAGYPGQQRWLGQPQPGYPAVPYYQQPAAAYRPGGYPGMGSQYLPGRSGIGGGGMGGMGMGGAALAGVGAGLGTFLLADAVHDTFVGDFGGGGYGDGYGGGDNGGGGFGDGGD